MTQIVLLVGLVVVYLCASRSLRRYEERVILPQVRSRLGELSSQQRHRLQILLFAATLVVLILLSVMIVLGRF